MLCEGIGNFGKAEIIVGTYGKVRHFISDSATLVTAAANVALLMGQWQHCMSSFLLHTSITKHEFKSSL